MRNVFSGKVLSLILVGLWAVSTVGLSEPPIKILDAGNVVTETLVDAGNLVMESRGAITSIESYTIHQTQDGLLAWRSETVVLGKTAGVVSQTLVLDAALNPISYNRRNTDGRNPVRSFIQGNTAEVTVISDEGVREATFLTDSQFVVLDAATPSLAAFPLMKLSRSGAKLLAFDALMPSAQHQTASTLRADGLARIRTPDGELIAEAFTLTTDVTVLLYAVGGRYVAGFQAPDLLFYRRDVFPGGLTVLND